MSALPRGPRGAAGKARRADASVAAGAGRGRRFGVTTTASVPSSNASMAPRGGVGSGRGRAGGTQGHDGSRRGGRQSTPTSHPNASSSAAGKPSQKIDRNHMQARWEELRSKREVERSAAIKKGLLADPTKKMSLADAITPVGTCQEMCPLFERVERIYQQMVDRAEKIPDVNGGEATPSEAKMVKRFRRPAAGEDEQIPSDIRTPETLKRTLVYLLDEVVGGGARLATIHKFVWDRTRAIRNDFSIQQVSKAEEVRIAVDCFEHIVRFHILALHQLANPLNLDDENVFVAQQEREQLNKALLSLIYYYNDYNHLEFPNQSEFRSYCILFELSALQPDLLDRVQAWPKQVVAHPRVEKAIQIHAAAGNTLHENGPLRPRQAFDLAQGNAVRFWDLVKSKQVTYLMACVAEIGFPNIRYMALQNLWKSAKRANAGFQERMQDWTADDVARLLGYDEAAQAVEFCADFGLTFKENKQGEEFLDFTCLSVAELDEASLPREQVFSYELVEKKRYHRTLSAVINGVSVAEAIRSDQVVDSSPLSEAPFPADLNEPEEIDNENGNENSLFFPDATRQDSTGSSSAANPFGQPIQTNPFQSNPFGQFGVESSAATKPAVNPFNTAGTGASTFGLNPTAGASVFGLGNATTTPSGTPAGSILGQAPKSAAEPIPAATFKNPFNTSSTTLQSTASIFTPQVSAISSGPGTFGKPSSTTTRGPAPTGLFGSTPTPFSGFGQTAPPVTAPVVAPPKDTSSTQKSLFGLPSATTTPSLFPSANAPAATNPWAASALSGGSTAPPAKDLFAQTPTTLASGAPTGQVSLPAPTWPPQASASAQPSGEKLFGLPAAETKAAPTQFADLFAAKKGEAAPTLEQAARPSLLPVSKTLNATANPDPKASSSDKVSSNSKATTSYPFQFLAPPPTQSIIPNAPQSSSKPAFQPTSTFPKHKSPLGSQEPLLTSKLALAIDLSRVERNVATIAFLEDQGILQQFVEHSVTGIFQQAVAQYRAETRVGKLQTLRTSVLSRKFFKIWKDLCWRHKLQRNAQRRRQRFSESARRDQNRAKYEVGMLDAQEAHRTREKFQAQQQAQISQLLQAGKAVDPVFLLPGHGPATGATDKAKPTMNGLKRKSTHAQSSMPPPASAPRRLVINGHKRSRTEDGRALSKSTGHLKKSDLAATARYNSMMSAPNGFWGSTNSSLTRSTSLGSKVDRTQTDHFRLKARGIDPGTPIFPETTASLERKKRSASDRPSSARQRVSPSIESPIVLAIEPADPSPPIPTPNKAFNPDEDEFLQQIRQVSRAMKEDSEWFSTQTQELGKEIEVQEEFNRSQQSSPPASNLTPNESGFLTSFNGYLYSPAPQSSSAQSLSRTEQRIRKTGAHGFATRPVDEYLAVAQSKTTSSQLRKVAKATSRKKRKVKTGERDKRHVYSSDEDSDDEEEEAEVAKGVRHTPPGNRKRKMASSSPQIVVEEEAELQIPTIAAPAAVLHDDSGVNGDDSLFGLARNSTTAHNFFAEAALAAEADEEEEEDEVEVEENVDEESSDESEIEIIEPSPVLRGASGQITDNQFEIYDDEEEGSDDTSESSSASEEDVAVAVDGGNYGIVEDASGASDEDEEDELDALEDGDTESLASDQSMPVPSLEQPVRADVEETHQDSPNSHSHSLSATGSVTGSAAFHMRLRSQSPQTQSQLQSQAETQAQTQMTALMHTQTVVGDAIGEIGSIGSPGSPEMSGSGLLAAAGASVEDALVLSD